MINDQEEVIVKNRPNTKDRVFYSYITNLNQLKITEITKPYYKINYNDLSGRLTILPISIPNIIVLPYIYWCHLPKFCYSINSRD